MTDELKTLKDLNKEDMSGPYGQSYGPDYVITKELRQEAIKWVKHLRSIGNCYNGLIQFFNLTEEDLK